MMYRISVITSLFHCARYLDYYFDGVNAVTNFDECEFVLIHNDPQPEEEEIISRRIAGRKNFIHVRVPRETLYTSWNRGIAESHAEYLANWNVDDRRTPDSLELMAATLDGAPEAAMTYGDTIGIREIGQITGDLQHQASYSEKTRKLFLHSHFIGCFQMWRRSIHEKVGYYDEQFKLAGDYEFQIRTAYFFPLKKTEGNMGYFLKGGGGARLSQQHNIQNTEQAAIGMRYGIYFKIHILSIITALRKYRIFSVVFYGKEKKLKEYFGSRFALKNTLKIYQMPWAAITLLPWEIARWCKYAVLKIAGK